MLTEGGSGGGEGKVEEGRRGGSCGAALMRSRISRAARLASFFSRSGQSQAAGTHHTYSHILMLVNNIHYTYAEQRVAMERSDTYKECASCNTQPRPSTHNTKRERDNTQDVPPLSASSWRRFWVSFISLNRCMSGDISKS